MDLLVDNLAKGRGDADVVGQKMNGACAERRRLQAEIAAAGEAPKIITPASGRDRGL
jgi:hypothetical protein